MTRKPCAIAILQPEVPHYRMGFFSLLRNHVEALNVFVYDKHNNASLNVSAYETKAISAIEIKGVLLYNPFALMSKRYGTIVCMLNFAHVTTWLLLFFNRIFHYKRILLWGHGISVKRYLKEEKKCDWRLRLMLAMSDGAWLYTADEAAYWKNIFPHKPIVALNNTISGIGEIVDYVSPLSKAELRDKYEIKEERIFLFCARFNSSYRRVDMLLDAIRRLDSNKNGFVIIGDGALKPDFSGLSNVYDMGAIYDDNIKKELFSLADIYFQPGWVGLSIVEAMGYGLPIFTFRRSGSVKQCVEYAYISNGYNGIIFENVDDLVAKIETLSAEEIKEMGIKAKDYVKGNLSMDNMVASALSIL